MKQAAADIALQRFDDCGTLLEHVHRATLAEVTAYGLPARGHETAVAVDTATGSTSGGSADAAPASGGHTGGPAFSGTNVQEAGADEPDIVRNDGRRVFTFFGSLLRAVLFEDGELRPVDEIDLDLPGDVELLEVGDNLIALAYDGSFTTTVVCVRGRGRARPTPSCCGQLTAGSPPSDPSSAAELPRRRRSETAAVSPHLRTMR